MDDVDISPKCLHHRFYPLFRTWIKQLLAWINAVDKMRMMGIEKIEKVIHILSIRLFTENEDKSERNALADLLDFVRFRSLFIP